MYIIRNCVQHILVVSKKKLHIGNDISTYRHNAAALQQVHIDSMRHGIIGADTPTEGQRWRGRQTEMCACAQSAEKI